MSDNARLRLWIEHVFDHPAKGRLWYFDADAPLWPGNGDDVPELMAAFEQGDEVLSALSDEALEQGFWYAIGAALVRAFIRKGDGGSLYAIFVPSFGGRRRCSQYILLHVVARSEFC